LEEAGAGPLRPSLQKQIILGLRPEHIVNRENAPQAPPDQTVEAVADVVQPMGSETHVYLASNAHSYVARVPASAPVRAGQKLSFVFEMSRAHFFDPVTERAIV